MLQIDPAASAAAVRDKAVCVGADEVNAIVIDVGSSTVKAGYAGDDAPKSYFPSVSSWPIHNFPARLVLSSGYNHRCALQYVGVLPEQNGNTGRTDVSREASANGAHTQRLLVGNNAVDLAREHMEVSVAAAVADWTGLDLQTDVRACH